jgi:hypothetical protein
MSISCQDLLPVVQRSKQVACGHGPRGLCQHACKSLLVGVWFILTRTYLPVPVESVCSQNDRQPWGSSVRLPIYILAKSCRAPLETTSCRNGSRDSAFWPQESRAFRSHETVKPLCRNPTRYRPGLCLQIAHLLLGCLRSSEWLAVDQMLVALVYYEAQLVIRGITARSQPGNWIVYYSWPIFSHGPSLRCCVYI